MADIIERVSDVQIVERTNGDVTLIVNGENTALAAKYAAEAKGAVGAVETAASDGVANINQAITDADASLDAKVAAAATSASVGYSAQVIATGDETLIRLAKNAGAAWFSPNLFGRCFKERSTNASTPCAVGDPIGCIRDETGSWYFIAPSDGERPTLQVDSSGNYYPYNATGKRMALFAADGVTRQNLGTSFTVMSVLMRDSGTYAWSVRDNNNFALTLAATTQQWANAAGTPTTLTSSSQTSKPFWSSVSYTEALVQGEYDSPDKGNPRTGSLDPANVGAQAAGPVIFAGNHANTASGMVGRLYSILFWPGQMSAATALAFKNYMQDAAWRAKYTATPTGPHEIDLDNDTITVGGNTVTFAAAIAAGRLTDYGNDQYFYSDIGYADGQATTVLFEISLNPATPPSGTILDLETVHGRRVWAIPKALGGGKYGVNAAVQGNAADMLDTWPGDTTQGYDGSGRKRYLIYAEPGQSPVNYVEAIPGKVDPAQSEIHPDHKLLGCYIGRLANGSLPIAGCTIHRIVLAGGIKTEAEILDLMSDGEYALNITADSFGAYDDRLVRDIRNAFDADGTHMIVANNPDSGKNMFGHARRVLEYIDYIALQILGVVEGVWEPPGNELVVALNSMVSRLGHERWFVTEANPYGQSGDVAFYAAQLAAIKSFCANATENTDPFVPITEPLQAHNDGSANDLADIAAGLWPRSLRQANDPQHVNDAGFAIFAQAIRAWHIQHGLWTHGTVSTPGQVQNLAIAGGNATWSLPANEGGHPVQGFNIYINGALQETKRKERRYAVTSGQTIRVRAVNYLGEGTLAEATA